MKKILLSFLLAAFAVVIASAQCTDPPAVNSFTPNTGFIGSTVTITGAHFDANTITNNKVFFGATQATVVSATFGQLVVTVPVGASTARIAVTNQCNLTAYSDAPFNGIFCPTPLTAATYDNTSFELTGIYGAYNMLAVDMDLDGRADVVSSTNGGNLTIARNTSTPNNLSFVASNLAGQGSQSIYTADFDGDGRQDLASRFSVFLNTSTGPGSIAIAAGVTNNGISEYQIAAGDFNNDGKIDLVGESGGSMYTAENLSTGVGNVSFGSAQFMHGVGGRATGIQTADVDGDGKIDILISQRNNHRAATLRNITPDGSSTFIFEAPEYWSVGGQQPYRCQIADFNKDGKIDFTTCNYDGIWNTAVLINSSTPGDINMSTLINLPSFRYNYRIQVGDVDGDGYPDIVSKSLGLNLFAVYRNTTATTGVTSFAPRIDYNSSATNEVSGIVIGDLDGDFVPDIATSGINSNTIRFHRNTSSQLDLTPPNAICQNITVALAPNGTVNITPAQVDNGSSDACGIDAITLSQTAFTCVDTGANSVTLYVLDNAGNLDSCTAIVTVRPAAIIVSGQTTVCDGQTVPLTANIGDSYQWKRDGVDIVGETAQNYTATITGDYTVIVTNAGGCSGESDPTTITVNSNPTVAVSPANVAYLCPTSVVLTASQSAIYQWKLNGVDIANATLQTYTATQVGSYTVQVIDLFGCSAISDPIAVNTTAAEIGIIGNGQYIVDGDLTASTADDTDFGNTLPNTGVFRTFTIENSGSGNMDVTAITVAGADAANWTISGITLPASIASGANTVFVATFNGAAIQSYNATIEVVSNDCDESNSDFAVAAEITCVGAQFSVCPGTTVNGYTSNSCDAVVNFLTTATGTNPVTGTYTLSGATTGNGAGDASGLTYNLGTTTVQVTATNACGLATCTFDVVVSDTIAPTAVCQNITVYLDALGNASITAADVDGGSTDNCAIESISIDMSNLSCANLGANNVTLTVTDSSGNVSTCTSTVTVGDSIAPNAITQDLIVYLDASGNASITTSDVDNGSTDNCGISSLTVSPNSFTCANTGANTVTLTLMDNSGNTSISTAIVTVDAGFDTDSDGIADICDLDDDNDGILDTDECSNAQIAWGDVQNNKKSKGFGDIAGVRYDISSTNTTFASDTIFGHANFPASFGLPNQTAFETRNSSSTNDITFSIPTINPVIAFAAIGDSNGAVSVSFDSPIELLFAQNVVLDSSTQITGTNGYAIVRFVGTYSSISFAYLSTTTRGNFVIGSDLSTTCVADIDGDGIENKADLDSDGDGCVDAIEAGHLDPDLDGILGTSPVTVDADGLVLNEGGYTGSTALVIDSLQSACNQPPIASCQGITLYTDASCQVSISNDAINNGSSDPDGDVLAYTISSNGPFTVGTHTVSMTVTDPDGEFDSCTATITVVDSTAPVVLANNLVLFLDAAGNVSITVADVDNGSFDNCGISTIDIDRNTFGCSDIGVSTSVLLSVTDNSGNTSTQTANIVVVDSIKPTLNLQDVTVYLDVSGQAFITSANVDNGSFDACGIESIGISDTMFDCSHVGANTIDVTVTDINLNKSNGTVTVTVIDAIAPEVQTNDVVVYLDANGNASITAGDIDNGSNDNCGIANISATPLNFDCLDVNGDNGITIVTDSTWTLSTQVDSSTALTFPWAGAPFVPGSSSFTLPVTIGQPYGYVSINPIPGSEVIRANRHITFYRKTFNLSNLDQLGTRIRMSVDDDLEIYVNGHLLAAEYSFSQSSFQGVPHDLLIDSSGVINGYNGGDVYGYASTTSLDSVFVLGTNEIIVAVRNRTGADRGGLTMVMDVFADFQGNAVTLSVTDVNGNTSTGSAVVTVIDTIVPVITQVPASFTAYTLSDDCTPPVYWTLPIASDACAIQSLNGTHHPGDHFPVGVTTVTYTAIDVNGNTSDASFDVTVIDTIAPTAVCNAFTVALDATGNASIVAADIDGGSSDACGIASTSIDVAFFSCVDVGTNMVTLTVVDIYGNTSSCVSMVTVEDHIAPVAVCQDITVALGANGLGDIIASMVNNGSSDACGIASLSIDVNNFSCANVGTNTVTLTVTDVNGNVSTCQSTVTVIDTIAPVVIAQDIVVQLDINGNASITANDIDNGSADACGIASLSVNPSVFGCADLGTNPVVLTVTDNNGNVSTISASVLIEESYYVDVAQQASIDLNCNTSIGGRYVSWDEPKVGSFSSCNTDTCPAGTNIPGFIYLGQHNGHRYFCSDNSNYTWNQANTAAQAAGGHLAVINDATENHYLACRVQAIYSWIGLTDQTTEDTFEWVNGDAFSFNKWSYYEPNNTGGYYCGPGGADHTVLKRWSGKWYDRRECNKHEFIMEVACGNDVVVNQVAGPTKGSLFTTGTSTVTYVAMDTVTGATDSMSFDVTIGDCTPVYCQAGGSNTTYEWIQKVKIGSMSNNSGNDNGYADYTSHVAHANTGDWVNLKFYPGFAGQKFKEYWTVFVDWNNDGDFNDYKECVFQKKSKKTVSGSMKVPYWAAQGNLRVRVIMNWGGYSHACCQFSYGEVEDYTIVIDDANGGGAWSKNGEAIVDNDDELLVPTITQELFNLYPNPALSGQVLSLDVRSAKDEEVEIHIFNGVGQLVYTQKVEIREGLNSLEVSPGDLATGTYIIRMNNQTESIPFVVK